MPIILICAADPKTSHEALMQLQTSNTLLHCPLIKDVKEMLNGAKMIPDFIFIDRFIYDGDRIREIKKLCLLAADMGVSYVGILVPEKQDDYEGAIKTEGTIIDEMSINAWRTGGDLGIDVWDFPAMIVYFEMEQYKAYLNPRSA